MENQLQIKQTTDEKPITIDGIDFISTGTIDNQLAIYLREVPAVLATPTATTEKLYEVVSIGKIYEQDFNIFQTTSLETAREVFNATIEVSKKSWESYNQESYSQLYSITDLMDIYEDAMRKFDSYLSDLKDDSSKGVVVKLLGFSSAHYHQKALFVKTFKELNSKEYFEIERPYGEEYTDPWGTNKTLEVCNINDAKCQNIEKELVDSFNKAYIEDVDAE